MFALQKSQFPNPVLGSTTESNEPFGNLKWVSCREQISTSVSPTKKKLKKKLKKNKIKNFVVQNPIKNISTYIFPLWIVVF
jgi:hypothetical protein